MPEPVRDRYIDLVDSDWIANAIDDRMAGVPVQPREPVTRHAALPSRDKFERGDLTRQTKYTQEIVHLIDDFDGFVSEVTKVLLTTEALLTLTGAPLGRDDGDVNGNTPTSGIKASENLKRVRKDYVEQKRNINAAREWYPHGRQEWDGKDNVRTPGGRVKWRPDAANSRVRRSLSEMVTAAGGWGELPGGLGNKYSRTPSSAIGITGFDRRGKSQLERRRSLRNSILPETRTIETTSACYVAANSQEALEREEMIASRRHSERRAKWKRKHSQSYSWSSDDEEDGQGATFTRGRTMRRRSAEPDSRGTRQPLRSSPMPHNMGRARGDREREERRQQSAPQEQRRRKQRVSLSRAQERYSLDDTERSRDRVSPGADQRTSAQTRRTEYDRKRREQEKRRRENENETRGRSPEQAQGKENYRRDLKKRKDHGYDKNGKSEVDPPRNERRREADIATADVRMACDGSSRDRLRTEKASRRSAREELDSELSVRDDERQQVWGDDRSKASDTDRSARMNTSARDDKSRHDVSDIRSVRSSSSRGGAQIRAPQEDTSVKSKGYWADLQAGLAPVPTSSAKSRSRSHSISSRPEFEDTRDSRSALNVKPGDDRGSRSFGESKTFDDRASRSFGDSYTGIPKEGPLSPSSSFYHENLRDDVSSLSLSSLSAINARSGRKRRKSTSQVWAETGYIVDVASIKDPRPQTTASTRFTARGRLTASGMMDTLLDYMANAKRKAKDSKVVEVSAEATRVETRAPHQRKSDAAALGASIALQGAENHVNEAQPSATDVQDVFASSLAPFVDTEVSSFDFQRTAAKVRRLSSNWNANLEAALRHSLENTIDACATQEGDEAKNTPLRPSQRSRVQGVQAKTDRSLRPHAFGTPLSPDPPGLDLGGGGLPYWHHLE